MESCQPIKRFKDKEKIVSTTPNGKGGFHFQMPGPGSISVLLRPVESAFAAAVDAAEEAAELHAAVAVAAPAVPLADAVAGAAVDTETAVGDLDCASPAVGHALAEAAPAAAVVVVDPSVAEIH